MEVRPGSSHDVKSAWNAECKRKSADFFPVLFFSPQQSPCNKCWEHLGLPSGYLLRGYGSSMARSSAMIARMI